jgi:fumarylpyruvate hydrolase
MTGFVFNPQRQASLAIAGRAERFPVHRIYCVGRNFAEHAKEMGVEAPKGVPVFFMKPADAVIQSPAIPYPGATADLHHEVELVVALGPDVPESLTEANASQAIFGYAVGLDLTRRDLQAVAKEKRLPWDTSKGFDASAPISALVERRQASISPETLLRLTVNGKVRQESTLADMIFSVPEILLALSKLYTLKSGDLIFMGTPAGVAALHRGDEFLAELVDIVAFDGSIV